MAAYKINTQKSVAFLYGNNELSERECKRTIPFKNISKRIKLLEINLTKKDLYSENYKTLKEIEDDITKKWKYIPCPLIGRINAVKMSIRPKATTDLMQSPAKYSQHTTRTNNPKVYVEPEKTLNTQKNLEKKEQSWRYHIP